MAEAYRVFIVVDRAYGERLSELRTGPVWIVDTPHNRAAAQKIWASDPNRSPLEGITTFTTGDDCSREDILLKQMETIDLHHGTDSADPPFTVLEVIGAVLNEKIKTELSHFGFDEFQATEEGFRSTRPVPSEDVSRE